MSHLTSIVADSRLELLGPGWRDELAQDIQRMRRHRYKPPKEVLKALEHQPAPGGSRLQKGSERWMSK